MSIQADYILTTMGSEKQICQGAETDTSHPETASERGEE